MYNSAMETKVCVTAFIYDTDKKKVLVCKRSTKETFHPSVYEMPGGKLGFGENIIGGIQREVLEETGLKVKVKKPFYAFDYISKEGERYNIEVVFFCVISLTPKVVLSESHVDYAWIAENEIDNYDITKEIKKALALGFKEVSNFRP